jgi:hypothetical protein
MGRNTLRLTATASEAESMPNEIFLHQQTLVNPITAAVQDEFIAICSPYDLSDYPANAPAAEQEPAFFRKATLDILLPGNAMWGEVRDEIEEQVRVLVALLDRLENLPVIDEVWIPDAPIDSSSSSSL